MLTPECLVEVTSSSEAISVTKWYIVQHRKDPIALVTSRWPQLPAVCKEVLTCLQTLTNYSQGSSETSCEMWKPETETVQFQSKSCKFWNVLSAAARQAYCTSLVGTKAITERFLMQNPCDWWLPESHQPFSRPFWLGLEHVIDKTSIQNRPKHQDFIAIGIHN